MRSHRLCLMAAAAWLSGCSVDASSPDDDSFGDPSASSGAEGGDGQASTTAGAADAEGEDAAASDEGTGDGNDSENDNDNDDGADDDNGDTTGGDDTGAGDTAGTTDAADDPGDAGDDGPGEDGLIDVSLSGCTIDFSGMIVVSYNGSLGVAAVINGGGALNGSFQFDLDGPATFALSSQHRVDTGTVVNMVDIGQGTWTNLDPNWPESDAVAGTMDVEVWSPAEGQATVHFDDVTLVNISNGNACTINGTVEAYELI